MTDERVERGAHRVRGGGGGEVRGGGRGDGTVREEEQDGRGGKRGERTSWEK